jgi:hypothetical protein
MEKMSEKLRRWAEEGAKTGGTSAGFTPKIEGELIVRDKDGKIKQKIKMKKRKFFGLFG